MDNYVIELWKLKIVEKLSTPIVDNLRVIHKVIHIEDTPQTLDNGGFLKVIHILRGFPHSFVLLFPLPF